uniref:Mythl transferase n=1 Tax=Phyllosticta capitalensis polymycovirus 2 TaxID=3367396 RepID=A0AB74UMB1_9VIRU
MPERRRLPVRPPRSPELTRTRRSSLTPSSSVSNAGEPVLNYALSTTNRSGSGFTAAGRAGQRVSLPFTLFEFGFPVKPSSSRLTESSQFTDDGGSSFMATEAGAILRANDTLYMKFFRNFMFRSSRLSGSSMLVLGCGSSKTMIPAFRRGLSSLVLVDTSEAALARMYDNLWEAGVITSTPVEFVCMDAWEYLMSLEEERFDIVVATKCLGLIFAQDPDNRDAYRLLDALEDVVNPDGSVYIDQHSAFAGHRHGQRISDVVPKQHYDLATIGGRYKDDVCYTVDVQHPSFYRVGHLSSAGAQTGYQVWNMVNFRRASPPPPPPVITGAKAGVTVPREFATPAMLPFDHTADKMIPVNAKGVKRVPTPGDIRGHNASDLLVKYDRTPGVLIVEDSTAVFVSPLYRFQRQLPVKVSVPIVTVAELVSTSPSTSVIIVVGLISVGDTFLDPLSHEALLGQANLLEKLAPSGIIPTLNMHARLMVGNEVQLPLRRGGVMKLPVDGVQIQSSQRAGVFIKPVELNTVDALPSEIVNLLAAGNEALGGTATFRVDHTGERPGTVCEYYRVEGTDLWRCGKLRPDKQASDKPGSVAHTVLCSYRVESVLGGKNSRELFRALAR